MTMDNLRAIAIKKHKEAIEGSRFWRTSMGYADRGPVAYAIRGACRGNAAKHLERAAAARTVYQNAERIHAAR